jgi:hypothetical protein
MEQRANFFDESIDRVQEAWTSMEGELERLQKNLEKRRKRFEKETQKQVKRLEQSAFGKRVIALRDDTQKQIESNIESLISLIPIASRAEVKRLERKVTTLTKKVVALEKAGEKTSTHKARSIQSAEKAEAQASA